MNLVNWLKCFQWLGIFAEDSEGSQSLISPLLSPIRAKYEKISLTVGLYVVTVLYLEYTVFN